VNDHFEERTGEAAWRSATIGWTLLVSAAWIVFELTANRLLVVATFCLKAGWQDARTALWMWRRDPDSDRRDVLVPIMLAWGLVKVMVTGLGTGLLAGAGLLLLSLAGLLKNVPQQLRADVIPLLATGAVGFLMSATVMYFAVPFTIFNKRRIWVDSSIRLSRRADAWPPVHFRANRFGWVWLTAVIQPVVGTLGNWAWHLGPQRNPHPILSAAVLAAIAVGSLAWGMIAMVFFRATVARSPSECWPDIDGGAAIESVTDARHGDV
jgi:hypothetical protein